MKRTVLVGIVAACACHVPPTAPPLPDAPARGERVGAPRRASVDDERPPSVLHDFTVRDLLAMTRLGQLAGAPDRRSIAFVRRTTDLRENRSRAELWQLQLDGGGLRRLTDGGSDHDPAWSPDGRTLYFLSSRSGSAQVWALSLAEPDRPMQVTDLPLPVENLVVSPTGDTLLFTAEVFPDCATLTCTRRRLDAQRDAGARGIARDRLFVRHWDHYEDGRRSHLFAFPLDRKAPIDLTFGLDADVPSRPFGGREEITMSPDGRTVVFTARDAGREEAWSTNFDLFAVPTTGGPRTRLTADNPAWDTHPRFSPDGRRIAWLAMARPGYESDRFVVHEAPWPFDAAQVRAITADWDRSPATLDYDDRGDRLWVTAQDLGQVALFEIDTATGSVTPRVGEGTISDVLPWGDDVAFLRHDLLHPAEVHRWTRASEDVTALTRVNAAHLAVARMGTPEQFDFIGAGGDRVYGYLVRPANFRPDARYPVVFLIHGGPQGSFGNMFHYRWNPQTYAGAGYAVVMIDFHGSTGYGQRFVDSIRGDWGGKPLEDLQKGLAHVLAQHPWLDGDRICALGASYGGYMVNWIAGEWPDRFDCLVNHAGVFDQRMMYYATDELWFPEWEQFGRYDENPERYERHNPALGVSRWRTPMLVTHGALDYRVPVTQGLATFSALQRRGIESALLVFPDENHWILRPRNTLQWHDTVEHWLARHLRP